MRKIVSKEIAEKKEKRNRRIVGFSLLALMVLSVFGIVVDSLGRSTTDTSKLTYKGVNFFNQQDRWFFSKDGANYSILNSPQNLSDIGGNDLNLVASYYGKPLYVSSNDQSLEAEVYYNFGQIAYRIQSGCLNESTCSGDFPIKTCEDNFVILQEKNQTSVVQQQNCVFISAPKQELQKTLDAFFLKIVGIN